MALGGSRGWASGRGFWTQLFSLSLFVRGRVPGGTTAGAATQYEQMRDGDHRCTYYGRVLRDSGYTVLQYLFFYAMNDWRSSFAGVNDHEADWEQVLIYIEESDSREPTPIWLACAAHDYTGADLRRRWDDPELTMLDGHPVVFAGAGSHAAYFKPGEYLTTVEVKFLRPLSQGARGFQRLWRDVLGQGDPAALVKGVYGLVRVPFVDYARGDGAAVGPNQPYTWDAVVIDDSVDWVGGYPGLWGLDTEDVFAGELAPAGPRFTRAGAIRQSWFDPLGWAGLESVPPPSQTLCVIEQRIEAVVRELREAEQRAADARAELERMEVEATMPSARNGAARHAAIEKQLEEGTAELGALEASRQELQAAIGELEAARGRTARGDRGDPRAHIRRSHEPQPPGELRASRLAETWAAVSVGLLLLAAALLLKFEGTNAAGALIALVAGAVIVDSILQRKIVGLLLNATIVLAAVTAGVLAWEFAWQIILVLMVGVALVIMRDNLRKLWGR